MTEKKTKAVTCPFCGAPYRKFIPPNTLQLECTYCRGIFLVPPEISGGLPKCFNHGERLAIGLCNDCGGNFCSECLYIYNLQTSDAEATLHLCLECLAKRHRKEADSFIYASVFFLFFGGIAALMTVSTGLLDGIFVTILFFILGTAMALYGFLKRSELPHELTINDVRGEHKRMKTEFTSMEEIDATELYNELLKKYINHWGLDTGTDLLDKEISAYLRHGADFEEAVRKIYQRQQNKHS
ncbi:MAG: hypothetical protein QXN36_07260 [Candidatus Bathyarchaeia archaeon]